MRSALALRDGGGGWSRVVRRGSWGLSRGAVLLWGSLWGAGVRLFLLGREGRVCVCLGLLLRLPPNRCFSRGCFWCSALPSAWGVGRPSGYFGGVGCFGWFWVAGVRLLFPG